LAAASIQFNTTVRGALVHAESRSGA